MPPLTTARAAQAAAHARRAIRRGDAAAAKRWLALTEQAIALAASFKLIEHRDAIRRSVAQHSA